jgi:hypothetical protein
MHERDEKPTPSIMTDWPEARSMLRVACLLVGLAPTSGYGQQAAVPSSTPPEGEKRPGKYRLGPFYLTPRFHLGPIALDTNVLFTPTERHPDVMVTLGPALELILPLGGRGRFYSTGSLDYLYFVRTASQRRLTGFGLGGLDFRGARTQASIEERYGLSFSRPNFEVNDRVTQRQEATEGRVSRRLFGRLSISLGGRRLHNDAESEDDYLGVDLDEALTYDIQLVEAEAAIALTVKTSIVAGTAYQRTRYPRDAQRDADRSLFLGGFRTNPTALVSGRLLLGVRVYRLQAVGATEQRAFYADIDEVLNISPRTRVGVSYSEDIADSIFVPETGTPTNRIETVGLRIEKDLTSRIDLRLFGRWLKSRGDGEISVEVPDEGVVTSVRNDDVREVGADLGYRLRPDFRIGVVASYTDRNSTISYFGVQGLLVGFNAQYNP